MAEIRALDPDHWREVREIRLRSLAEAPDAFTSTFDRESGYDENKWRELATTGRWFVADDEGPVGVAVGIDGWTEDPKARELVGMWVAPSHRGRGIARQLPQEVKVWAASQEATTLKLGVRDGNQSALAAYVSMGMRPTGEHMPDAYQPTRVITVMECDL